MPRQKKQIQSIKREMLSIRMLYMVEPRTNHYLRVPGFYRDLWLSWREIDEEEEARKKREDEEEKEGAIRLLIENVVEGVKAKRGAGDSTANAQQAPDKQQQQQQQPQQNNNHKNNNQAIPQLSKKMKVSE